MEKTSWTDRVKYVRRSVAQSTGGKGRNVLHTIKRRLTIGHMLHRDCLLKKDRRERKTRKKTYPASG
jgi:hypothetical protein